MQHQTKRINSFICGISMILAPLFFALSTFLWIDGQYGVSGGTLVAVGTVFWIVALTGVYDLLKHKTPVFATIGWLIAVAGCVSGANFGFAGAYNDIFDISHQHYLEQLAAHQVAANVLLFWSGPLFPLSLLVLGAVLIRTRTVPFWTGLLISIAGIAFPISRIPRIEWIAHACDLLLFIPFCFLGLKFISGAALETEKPA